MKLHATILGEGTPLLILHGFLGMSDNWKTLGRRFADEGFQVHLIDQRNHGRSPHSDAFSYDLLANDIREYCEAAGFGSCVLLGHSMGGKTAMFAASLFPDLVQKLIVADISPKYYRPHHQQILKGLQALDKAELKGRREASELLAEFVKEEGVRLFLLKNLYWVTKEKLGLRLNLPALINNVDAVGQALPEEMVYDGPALFIKGGNSDYILEEDKDLILDHFPKADLETIPETGHWLHAEDPDAFFNAVLRFL